MHVLKESPSRTSGADHSRRAWSLTFVELLPRITVHKAASSPFRRLTPDCRNGRTGGRAERVVCAKRNFPRFATHVSDFQKTGAVQKD